MTVFQKYQINVSYARHGNKAVLAGIKKWVVKSDKLQIALICSLMFGMLDSF